MPVSELATCVDGDGLSAVVHAMMSGNLPAATLLLQSGASPNTKDGMGMTPLHHAVMGENPEARRLLV
jgi:ankyrin repeat protein